MKAKYLGLYVGVLSIVALMSAGVASAAADATITSAGSSLTTYFTDNLPTVIGAFIAVAMAVWLLGLLFRSVGVRKPSKVG
jgi:hypothetical protein